MQLDLPKHIVEHEILGISDSGSAIGTSRYIVLMTSPITPGSNLNYPIDNNINGQILLGFNQNNIQEVGIEITGTNLKPVYDSSNIFTRTKVKVESYDNNSHEVQLNVLPNNDFIIHYQYYLSASDNVSNYVPNDIVTDIEAQYHTTQIARKVAFNNTNTNILNETDVQGAIDKLSILVNNTEFKGKFPLETPDGSIDTFTIPYGYAASQITVFLNGVAYRPENIILGTNKKTFKITDIIPINGDSLTINFTRLF